MAQATEPHFMLVPALGCPAACSYCFGPHQGPTMTPQTMEAALDFIAAVARENGQRRVGVTFHGGEPLLAGHDLWRQALEGLRGRFGPRGYRAAVQSNLWLLDDAFWELFREHGVRVSTSLDGPEDITDAQRGSGYFQRTMTGIHKANSYGISTGCIVTFTPASVARWEDVFDFLLDQRLGISIHAAVPPLDTRANGYSLTTDQYGTLLCRVLDRYVPRRREIAIDVLDQMCQGVAFGEGRVCTFRDCLGMFLAIDPCGDIYPCQRFCGRPAYRLGNLAEKPTHAQLLQSPVAKQFLQRQQQVDQACADCVHLGHCRGGCAYNAWSGGNFQRVRDPYCSAYHAVFDHIQAGLLREMAAEKNIEAIAARRYDGRGHLLLREGPLTELACSPRHPTETARTAKRIVAAVELARCGDLPTTARRLVEMGICRNEETALISLTGLQERLKPQGAVRNNLYLHVTFRCQLHCAHCYARADARGGQQGEMSVEDMARLHGEARQAGFRQVVVTGGEPLVHSRRDWLLSVLSEARLRTDAMNLVLRTNLATALDDDALRRVALAFDQVVVSLDGGQQTHDVRRGRGAYAATVANLERYVEIAPQVPQAGELSLATVMSAEEIQGEPGQAVQALAVRLGVRRVRFRPILPLGRAADWSAPPTSEAMGAHAEPRELLEGGFQPVATCGLGQNLYVEPSGESFPCYAYQQPHAYLGNVVELGLAPVLASNRFGELASHTVDTNRKCRACEVRYLCGGACRAWGGERTQRDLDAPPPECDGLKRRADALLRAASAFIELAQQERHGL